MAICVAIDGSGFLVNTGVPVASCTSYVLMDVSDYNGSSQQALVDAFTWNAEYMELAFLGVLVMFAVGLGTGLIVSQIRKLRTP